MLLSFNVYQAWNANSNVTENVDKLNFTGDIFVQSTIWRKNSIHLHVSWHFCWKCTFRLLTHWKCTFMYILFLFFFSLELSKKLNKEVALFHPVSFAIFFPFELCCLFANQTSQIDDSKHVQRRQWIHIGISEYYSRTNNVKWNNVKTTLMAFEWRDSAIHGVYTYRWDSFCGRWNIAFYNNPPSPPFDVCFNKINETFDCWFNSV